MNNRNAIDKLIICLVILEIMSITLPICNAFAEPTFTVKWGSWLLFSFLGSMVLIIGGNTLSEHIKVDRTYLCISLFLAYLAARAYVTNFNEWTLVNPICFWLTYSFFYFQKENMQLQCWIEIALIFVGVIQAAVGMVQYVRGDAFVMGTYDNPAGFAISLSCILPFAYSAMYKAETEKIKLVYGVSIVLISVAVFCSDSRTGMIASLAVLMFWRIKKHMLLGAILIVLFFFLSLFYKSKSAQGRAFIYRTSISMIDMYSVLGGKGYGAFKKDYMKYQASELRKCPDTDVVSILADNVFHPFNEFLLVLIEYGVIGLSFLISVLWLVFTSREKNKPCLLCIVNIIISSLFSYPFRYPLLFFLSAYVLASFRTAKTYNIPVHRRTSISILFVLCLCGLIFTFDSMWHQYAWKRQIVKSSLGKYQEARTNYEKLLPSMQHNPYFLFNYSSLLFQMKEFHTSLEVMIQCTLYLNDYDTEMLLADNCNALGNYLNSERHYIQASLMCPNRFRPLCKLMQLYKEKGEIERGVAMARRILEKPVKIPSQEVREMRNEARIFLNIHKSM